VTQPFVCVNVTSAIQCLRSSPYTASLLQDLSYLWAAVQTQTLTVYSSFGNEVIRSTQVGLSFFLRPKHPLLLHITGDYIARLTFHKWIYVPSDLPIRLYGKTMRFSLSHHNVIPIIRWTFRSKTIYEFIYLPIYTNPISILVQMMV
jgi:hypothetical protein